MSEIAVVEERRSDWAVERDLQQDLAYFLDWYWCWSVDYEVPVPGIGRCDLVVMDQRDRLVAVEVKNPRSVTKLIAAAGQAKAYASGLGADRAAVAINGAGHLPPDSLPDEAWQALRAIDVDLWCCFEMDGGCDDVHFFSAEEMVE